MINKLSCLIVIFLAGFSLGRAQSTIDSNLVQFSGLILEAYGDTVSPLPFANVLIKNSNRGTYSNFDGFFSIVAEKGDTLIFSSVGFKTQEYVIPRDLATNRYTAYQIMTQDTFTLPETVVYPWPSPEHFEIEFLALEVPDDLGDIAEANLAAEKLQRLRSGTAYDGIETGQLYLRRQAQSYYSIGQAQPIQILNPLAWAQFVKAWKRGDFKKKKK